MVQQNIYYENYINGQVLRPLVISPLKRNAFNEQFEAWLNNLFSAGPPPVIAANYNDVIGRVNQRVFDDVFRTFQLMYPVMGFIGCPMKFQEWRGQILTLTDPNAFNSAAYMPVTRSLSAGQRRILVAYTEFLGKLPMMSAAKMLGSTGSAIEFRRKY